MRNITVKEFTNALGQFQSPNLWSNGKDFIGGKFIKSHTGEFCNTNEPPLFPPVEKSAGGLIHSPGKKISLPHYGFNRDYAKYNSNLSGRTLFNYLGVDSV